MRNTSDGFATVANGMKWRKGDNIVTFAKEFPANFYAWRRIRDAFGVELRLCPESDGRIDLDEFINLIDANTKLVSISAVQFASGFARIWKESARRREKLTRFSPSILFRVSARCRSICPRSSLTSRRARATNGCARPKAAAFYI
jgi:hypothetical protein